MNTPLVSIVIITRSRCKEVQACIDSALAQDYANIELVIVDNASSDDTCQTITQKYPQAKLLAQKTNTGVAGGRNIGIAASSGSICLCIDDDAIFLDPASITRCVPYFENPSIACLALRIVDQYGNIVKKLIPRRDRKIITMDTEGANFSGTAFAVRREVFTTLGGFWEKLNPYFGEEPDFTYRLLDAGHRIMHTPFISIRHYESTCERPKTRRPYYGARNAPWMALRSLPWPCVISLTLLSWAYFFLLALKEGQLSSFLRSAAESVRGMPEVLRMRKPVTRNTCRTLWRHSGLLFY